MLLNFVTIIKFFHTNQWAKIHQFTILLNVILSSLQKFILFNYKQIKIQKHTAFSLVEMLMALLVASLLLAALAPVMTRKMNENVIVSGTGSAVMLQGGCMFMEGNHENVCKLPANTLSIGVIIASGGGGGGGAAKMILGNTNYSDSVNGVTINSVKSNTITLDKNALDVTVQLVGGGGGGGLGSTNNGGFPKDQADCGNWGSFIGAEYSPIYKDTGIKHSVCVTRRNPELNGANNSPKLNVAGVTHVNVGTNCTNTNCCWIGKTLDDCNELNGGNYYSGCNRPVCTWGAANIICSSYKPASAPNYGRLPTIAENDAWRAGISYLGVLNKYGGTYGGTSSYPGLQLCFYQDGGGATTCSPAYHKNYCTGAAQNGSCHPHVLWTEDGQIGAHRTCHYGNATGSCPAGTYDDKYAFSPRCVVERISPFISIAGGGGGPALYAEMKIPDDSIRKALLEGPVQITYTAGGGGKGAYVQTNSGDTSYIKLTDPSRIVSAKNGEESSVTMTVNGVTKWKFSVPGGLAGKNASVNTAGVSGLQINVSSSASENSCYYKNSYSVNNDYKTGGYFACNSINDNGVLPNLNTGIRAVNNGSGGSGYFAGMSKTGGAINSTPDFGGAGGGGSSCTEGPTREYAICSNAGNGGGGIARITYKLSRPGAGGGGGAAGAVVHIPNITTAIRPDTTFDIKVGSGGQGGAAGREDDSSNGTQGGTSSIEWKDGNTIRYIRLTGGEGGKRGIMGKPDEGINGKDSMPGAAGQTPPVLSMSSGIAGKNDYIMYPSDLSKTKGKSVVPNVDYIVNYYAAPGGNGGINSKISPLDKKPCGGWSNIKIDYYGAKDIPDDENTLGCKLRNTDDTDNPYAGTFIPYSIAVSSDDSYRPDSTFKSVYAHLMSKTNTAKYAGSTIGGSTGGGGGGWKWDENQNEQAFAGANGMPGYIIIYWNLEKDE